VIVKNSTGYNIFNDLTVPPIKGPKKVTVSQCCGAHWYYPGASDDRYTGLCFSFDPNCLNYKSTKDFEYTSIPLDEKTTLWMKISKYEDVC
jgi:hypothetical protein